MYTFDTVLLSAQKTGFPNLIGTSLSANGVNTITLSAPHNGICFNARSTTTNILSNMTINGSLFRVNIGYHNSLMAVVNSPVRDIQTYTVFLYTSAATTPSTPLSAGVVNVSNADTIRKWVLGYK